MKVSNHETKSPSLVTAADDSRGCTVLPPYVCLSVCVSGCLPRSI